MKKLDLAARLARRAHITKAAAADRLDRAVHEILTELKRGRTVLLPGVGSFTPGNQPEFQFERSLEKSGERRAKKR